MPAPKRKQPLRRLSEDAAGKPLQTAKLFRNGRSQAVRLPKEFRFDGDEVYVRRDGESVVLTPKDTADKNPWQDFFDALDMIEPGFKFERRQPTEQQVRKSVGMEAIRPKSRKARST